MTNGDYSVLEICNDCGKISNWDSIKAKQDVLKIKNEDRVDETEGEGTTEEEKFKMLNISIYYMALVLPPCKSFFNYKYEE